MLKCAYQKLFYIFKNWGYSEKRNPPPNQHPLYGFPGKVPLVTQTQKLIIMKAICVYNEGNSFDPEVGDIVSVTAESFHITRLWRGGKEIDLEDPKRPGYFKPAETILSLLEVGDQIEENYCHGMYRVV